MRIIFTMPESGDSALLYLKADKGKQGSFVHFDDARIVTSEIKLNDKHYFSEDFEHVDEGIFPFVPGNGSIRVHLSEKHEGYTDDVIEGRFSLKITSRNSNGLMAQTLPCNLRFVPGKTYKISFRYKADMPEKYSVVLKSRKGGEASSLINTLLGTGTEFNQTVTIGKEDDYYLSIYKQERKEDSNLVIDEIVIDEI